MPTHRESCRTQDPDFGFIFHRGKPHQTPVPVFGALLSWSKESAELKVVLLLSMLLVRLLLAYRVQFGRQHFKNLRDVPE